MSIKILIAEEVKYARNKFGYTQEQIAEVAMISVRGYQYIEYGKIATKAKTLIRLMIFLDISPNAFGKVVGNHVSIRSHNYRKNI